MTFLSTAAVLSQMLQTQQRNAGPRNRKLRIDGLDRSILAAWLIITIAGALYGWFWPGLATGWVGALIFGIFAYAGSALVGILFVGVLLIAFGD
jgi:uncharacterized membrane protein YpjA